jgi:hypothetical protein
MQVARAGRVELLATDIDWKQAKYIVCQAACVLSSSTIVEDAKHPWQHRN